MVEGHQSIEVLERLPLHRLKELADGVTSIIREKNNLSAPPTTPDH